MYWDVKGKSFTILKSSPQGYLIYDILFTFHESTITIGYGTCQE